MQSSKGREQPILLYRDDTCETEQLYHGMTILKFDFLFRHTSFTIWKFPHSTSYTF